MIFKYSALIFVVLIVAFGALITVKQTKFREETVKQRIHAGIYEGWELIGAVNGKELYTKRIGDDQIYWSVSIYNGEGSSVMVVRECQP